MSDDAGAAPPSPKTDASAVLSIDAMGGDLGP